MISDIGSGYCLIRRRFSVSSIVAVSVVLALLFTLVPRGGATTFNVSSLTQSNMLWCASHAKDGDVFVFPQGAASFSGISYTNAPSFYFGCVWTNAVTLQFAPGSTITNTDVGDNYSHSVFYVNMAAPNLPFRITGLTIDGNRHGCGIRVGAGRNVRIDHCNLNNCNVDGIVFQGLEVFGVIDHCNFTNTINNTRVYGNDNASWNDSIDVFWAMGTTNCVCIEDCRFVVNDWYGGHIFHYNGQGSRATYRHNTYTSTITNNPVDWMDAHGNNCLLPNECRGTIWAVVENNSVTIPYTDMPGLYIRGGCLIMQSNNINFAESSTVGVSLTDEEDWYYLCSAAGSTTYGSLVWTNWPRQDQITNTWFVANTFNGNPVDGSYITNHFRSLALCDATSPAKYNDRLIIQEGRDFFVTNSIPTPTFNNPGIPGGWWGYAPLVYPHPRITSDGSSVSSAPPPPIGLHVIASGG